MVSILLNSFLHEQIYIVLIQLSNNFFCSVLIGSGKKPFAVFILKRHQIYTWVTEGTGRKDELPRNAVLDNTKAIEAKTNCDSWLHRPYYLWKSIGWEHSHFETNKLRLTHVIVLLIKYIQIFFNLVFSLMLHESCILQKSTHSRLEKTIF